MFKAQTKGDFFFFLKRCRTVNGRLELEIKSHHFKPIAPPITLPLPNYTCIFSLYHFLPVLLFFRLVFLLRTEWLP